MFWFIFNLFEEFTPRGRIYVACGNHDHEQRHSFPGHQAYMFNWTKKYLRREIDATIHGEGPWNSGAWGSDEKANISATIGNFRLLIPSPDSNGVRQLGEWRRWYNITFDPSFISDFLSDFHLFKM